jgi:hypothetical protein
MALKQRDLRNDSTSSPPLAPLAGGALAKRDRVMSAYANPDRLLANNRRVIGRVGQHCSEKMQVGSADPDGGTQLYPTISAQRVALRAKWQPTPGCFPVLSALVLPSGMTQRPSVEPAPWIADVPFGELHAIVTFVGAGSETVTFSKKLPISGEKWAGEKQSAGAAWSSLTRVEIPLIYPDDAKNNANDLHDWCHLSSCELTLVYQGGVRVVDAVVQERPHGYVRNVGVDTAYATPMVVDGSGKIVKTYPVEYPVCEKSPTDPCYGSLQLADVVHRQHTSIGPILAQFTSWDETTQPVTALEAQSVSTNSTTFVSLLSSSITAWSASNSGWSLSSGGNAQQWKSSNAQRVMRDKNAVVPVRVWALCWRTGAGTATVRLQSEGYSIAELLVNSSTETWRSFTGYLRCGLGAEDSSVLNLLGRTSVGTTTLHVRYLIVEYLDL